MSVMIGTRKRTTSVHHFCAPCTTASPCGRPHASVRLAACASRRRKVSSAEAEAPRGAAAEPPILHTVGQLEF
eukprot:357862-Chlamydomonas_euryale.AAC.2